MPVHCEYFAKENIISFDLKGFVKAQEFVDTINTITFDGTEFLAVDHLCMFHQDTDLSELNFGALKQMNECIKTRYDEIGLTRHREACILDGSIDAKIVMPLWRALCDFDSETEVDVKFFSTKSEAANWLGIDVAIVERILSSAAS